MDANISDDAGHVTVTDNGSFTKTLIVTGIDSDGRGDADKDSSEEFTRITVSGVPEGITIPNGIYRITSYNVCYTKLLRNPA